MELPTCSPNPVPRENLHDDVGDLMRECLDAVMDENSTESALADSIERVVQMRTGGSIRELRVQVFDGQVCVSGRTSTYYNKQLATHAVMGEIGSARLTNDIEVC